MLSKSGGVAVRPVAAARRAIKRSPAFQPCSSASVRSFASSASGASRSGASPSPIPSAISGRAASSAARAVAASQRFGTRSAGSCCSASKKRKSVSSIADERSGILSRISGRSAAISSSVPDGQCDHQRRPDHRRGAGVPKDRRASTSESTGR